MCSVSEPSVNEGQIPNFRIILKRLYYYFPMELWHLKFYSFMQMEIQSPSVQKEWVSPPPPSPSRSRKKHTATSRSPMLTYSISDMWRCRLTIRGGKGSSQKHFVSPQPLYQYIKMWQYFQASSLCMTAPKPFFFFFFFAWRKKLVVQVYVNRLLAVLCRRTGGSQWTQKECRAKRNVLPVHLIHIKPIIFGHPLRLDLFFIAVTSGGWSSHLLWNTKERHSFRITVFNVRIMWSGQVWKSNTWRIAYLFPEWRNCWTTEEICKWL